MDTNSKQSTRRDNILSSLDVIIEGLNLAESLSSITPAKAVFSTVKVILTMIRDSMANKEDYVDLGLACGAVCTALDRGLKEKQLSELSGSVLDAISQLTTTLADIRSKVAKRSRQNAVSRTFSAKKDGQTIASWRVDLNRILLVFNTELGLNIYATVSDVHDGITKTHVVTENTQAMVSDIHSKLLSSQTQTSATGESPPPAPRACFGRAELIDKVVGLAENLTPVALIGPGGIGKTSVALAVLHHENIKKRFGGDRRFIRCDKFPASCAHLLSRLSEVIGAGIENPKNLASLRPSLSSKEMFIVLDNAESILDPEGTDAEEIYAVVEELSGFDNICLCITSRITTIPSDCETIDVPTLTIQAARDAFHRIYKNAVERADLVDKILDQLDFHPLSITLLATVAHQNKWGVDRLAREWEGQRTRMLRPMHNKSFAATIELSLTSPMFQELGPDARGLLEVIAFSPRGVDENNLDWLFPTISNGADILDKFCALSLTYRSDSLITMLAPLRDHLFPKDPKSSPLLCTTKGQYFTRLSVDIHPNKPSFGEAFWITSEDVNVEHLLDVFTTIDANSEGVWNACANFIAHLFWRKPRLTILGPKIEGLPDDHHDKPRCLFELARLVKLFGNNAERKRLLTHALRLWRERGDDSHAALTLGSLSNTNQQLGLYEEGIQQAKEALEAFERLNDTIQQARCLASLATLLEWVKQFDAAEEAASRAMDLSSEEGDQYEVCRIHRLLGSICCSKGETEKAIHHYEAALGSASSFDWTDQFVLVHYNLAMLFHNQSRFDDAQAHVEQMKACAVKYTYYLPRAMWFQAFLWFSQHRLEEARAEALCAVDALEKLGAASETEECRSLLQLIEEGMNKLVIPDDPVDDSQVPKTNDGTVHVIANSSGWISPYAYLPLRLIVFALLPS